MAAVEEALYATLATDASITNLIAGRVYPTVRPQGDPLPALTFMRVSTTRQATLDGMSTLVMARFQFDSLGETYEQTVTLDAAVRALLKDRRETIQGVDIKGVFVESSQDTYDEPTEGRGIGTYVRMTDILIWHKE